jgi:hypothetical protein
MATVDNKGLRLHAVDEILAITTALQWKYNVVVHSNE